MLSSSAEEEAKANPQMALSTLTPVPYLPAHPYEIGVVIFDGHESDPAVAAMFHLVSCCRMNSLVILQNSSSVGLAAATTSTDKNTEGSNDPSDDSPLKQGTKCSSEDRLVGKEWLIQQGVRDKAALERVEILYGEAGFSLLLRNDEIDALYLNVPTDVQHKYVIEGLAAKKHILLNDPVSTSLDGFMEQLEACRRVNRFVQFRTMFVHHHRVKLFMDCVLLEKTFGSIESINIELTVNHDDMTNVGVSWPLPGPGSGCLRRLGRYCTLITALMLSRAGSQPVSAQVLECTRDENTGETTSAKCVVHFTDNRMLTFHVAYSTAPTRQVLEVRAHRRYATMTDFVIPHPDGLASYRVYEKSKSPVSGKLEVVEGQAVDVPSGPSQAVMMWRHFRELCLSVERNGWDCIPCTARAREITNVSLQMKKILIALDQSLAQGYAQVPVVALGS